jgi:hypothetical protein
MDSLLTGRGRRRLVLAGGGHQLHPGHGFDRAAVGAGELLALAPCLNIDVLADQLQVLDLVRPFDLLEDVLDLGLVIHASNRGQHIHAADVLAPDGRPVPYRPQ